MVLVSKGLSLPSRKTERSHPVGFSRKLALKDRTCWSLKWWPQGRNLSGTASSFYPSQDVFLGRFLFIIRKSVQIISFEQVFFNADLKLLSEKEKSENTIVLQKLMKQLEDYRK